MKEFIKCASIRAIRTMAQTMCSFITIGLAISEIDWASALSISLVAGIYSIVNSIATGLPEVDNGNTKD